MVRYWCLISQNDVLINTEANLLHFKAISQIFVVSINAQCGNLTKILLVRFFVKSLLSINQLQKMSFHSVEKSGFLREINFGESRRSRKCCFCHFRDSEFCSFGNFQPLKSAKINKNQISVPQNVLKWQILHFIKSPKLISRKICVIEKS